MTPELCVTPAQVVALDLLPTGALIRNGYEPGYAYFVKGEDGLWRPSDSKGRVFSDRTADERFDEPIWLGPFEAQQIHRLRLKVL